jgi:hypothetical protein
MTATSTNRQPVIKELFTLATEANLNAQLIDRGIAADKIVAIHYVTGQPLANGTCDQFRVLYRVS